MKNPLPSLTALAITGVLAASVAFAADGFSGKFVSNGKPHPLKYAGVYMDQSEGRNDDGDIVLRDRLNLFMTEKAPPAGKALNDDFVASGELGHYVIAEFDPVSAKKEHDSIGGPEMRMTINYGGGGFLAADGVKLEGGTLSGRLHTDGEEDFMGEKIEIDATFAVEVP